MLKGVKAGNPMGGTVERLATKRADEDARVAGQMRGRRAQCVKCFICKLNGLAITRRQWSAAEQAMDQYRGP